MMDSPKFVAFSTPYRPDSWVRQLFLADDQTVEERLKMTAFAAPDRYTPGPWKVTFDEQLRCIDGIDTEDLRPAVWDEETMEPTRIVETDSGCYPPRLYDAYLIAAAPELLEALKAARSCFAEHFSPSETVSDGTSELLAKMNAAIQKAEGNLG